ncbi:hypothetical protein LINPERHAP1_LOCUS13489 [Linum perenne]
MRIRVQVDVREPLKRDKKLKRQSGVCVLAKFRYEKLPTFCFICGRLGHIDRHCEIYFRLPDDQIIRYWDISLRAPPRRNINLGGEKWLVEEPGNGEGSRILTEKSVNTPTAATPPVGKLSANLGASFLTKDVSLGFAASRKVGDASVLVIAEERRPRLSNSSSGIPVAMDVDGRKVYGAAGNFNGIQEPTNPAPAGLHDGSSCPKQ